MSAAGALKNLLAPLGVYSWGDDSFQWAELKSAGAALDLCVEELEEIQREMSLMTAQGEGLEGICRLIARRPVTETPEQMAKALAALLRIGDRSFTLEAIRDNLLGCGIQAVLSETDTPGKVEIAFPYVGGIPDDIVEIRQIIEAIIPCHLKIDYQFWYLTWAELEAKIFNWAELEGLHLTWRLLESYVE